MFPADSKILIIDDSSFTRSFLKGCLKELGFQKVLEAEKPSVAQSLLTHPDQVTAPVHLMICDIHMPEMTGLDLVRWTRSREELKTLPIIVITTSQEKSDILDAGRLGVSNFIIKPFDAAMLKDRITNTWVRFGKAHYEKVNKK